jgi:hypothetical protein
MKKTVMGLLFVCIFVSTVLISVTASTALVQSEAETTAHVAPAAPNAEILSVTYWVNGEKHDLPFYTTDIYVGVADRVAFQVKGKYTGPSGTTGELMIYEETDVSVMDSYLLIRAGTVKKLTSTQAWSRSAPGTRDFGFFCLVPGTTIGLGRGVTVHYT